jgi:hypothetical protein
MAQGIVRTYNRARLGLPLQFAVQVESIRSRWLVAAGADRTPLGDPNLGLF